MKELVVYQASDRIAKVTMDDGKVNVMSVAMLDALHAAFDQAERDKAIVILTGRAGTFSAGFDLNVFAKGSASEAFEMTSRGAELALRILAFPTPVIAACNGHAFPMGAFLMLASDVRVGAEGPFKIGLNEVAIGITVPSFALELARQRLTAAHLSLGAVTGKLFSPTEALAAGFLDQLVPAEALQTAAYAIAESLTKIDLPSHAATKARLRGASIKRVRAAIDAEIKLDIYQHRAAVARSA